MERDTVPAPPVPSKNPFDEERKKARNLLRKATVAVLEVKPSVFVGLTIDNGSAVKYTVEMTEDVAHEWLARAQGAAQICSWIPTVCSRCLTIRVSPGLCQKCVLGGQPEVKR